MSCKINEALEIVDKAIKVTKDNDKKEALTSIRARMVAMKAVIESTANQNIQPSTEATKGKTQKQDIDQNKGKKEASSTVKLSTPKSVTSGFNGYAIGFDGKGKGTPEGDGKDKAMRTVADGFIGEIGSRKGSKSSTATSLKYWFSSLSDKELDREVANGTKSWSSINRNMVAMPKNAVIMLARNSEFSNKPLSDTTKRSIAEELAHGSSFVVGDMPNVDTQFIEYLNEIGATYTVYSTARSENEVFNRQGYDGKEWRNKLVKDATIAVNTAGEQALNAELDKTATPLDSKYATLVAGIVNTVNKISAEKDSAIVLKHIANGIEKYIGGEYDPKNNTLKVAIVPTMEQAFAAADGLTNSLYYRYIEDKQIADEDLNAYTNNDPYYTQLKESIPQVAQTLLEEASDIIRNSGLHSVTHEYVHAGAVRFMRDNPNHPASKRIVDIFTKVQHKRYDSKFAKAGLKDGYWKTDVNEFLAEALSNPKLMVALSTIKLTYSDKLASALEWAVTAAMQMLGFKQKGSAYEFVMDGFAAIIEAQKAQNEVEMQDPTMIASKVVSKVEDDIINNIKAVGEELELRPVLVEAALEKLKACKG